jgi:hypothetical protein
MLAIFHSSGIDPVRMDMLNSLHNDGAIAFAVSVNSLAEIPSGPVVLLVSRDLNR